MSVTPVKDEPRNHSVAFVYLALVINVILTA
jgi:hypothetical protein